MLKNSALFGTFLLVFVGELSEKLDMKFARVFKNKTKTTPYIVKYYDKDGKRREKPFKNETAANIFADDLNNKANLPHELTFTPAHRIEFAKILQLAEAHGVSLDKILDLIRSNIEQVKVKDVLFKTAFFEFKKDLERRNARTKTIKFYEQRCLQFQKESNITQLSEITVEKTNSYLEVVASPAHMKRAMRAMLNFCRRRHWISTNPFVGAEIPRLLKARSLPKIITLDDIAKLLRGLDKKHIPAFALMAFAGIRPMEIVKDHAKKKKNDEEQDDIKVEIKPVLEWQNIDFKKRQIRIPEGVAKTKKERLIAHAPGNLWAWLEKYAPKKKRGAVFPDPYEAYRNAKEAAGVKLSHDILRHSFATYAYHTIGRDHTIEILGHDLGTYEKHYKALATKPESIAYFKIRPTE